MPRTLLLASLVALLPQTAALAQIATDGTTGPRVNLSGGRIEVGAGLGTQAGGNLFHSFETFNVNRGQTVTFTGPDSVRNVVGRVTGGGSTTIDGTLRSTVGQADVYLINPAGVTFGPSAVVDVPASLHVGTAHEVRFADGARFSALDKSGSSLTTAPPQAFGFLARPTGPLTVDGSQLAVKPGQTLSLVGGAVAVRGGAAGSVAAPGGAVTVAAVGGSGQVRLTDGSTDTVQPGPVRLHDRARVTTSGNGGGSVKIRGGALVIDNATVTTHNTGGTDAPGGIDVQGTSVDIRNSRLTSEARGSGKGAPITLRAGTLTLREGTRVTSTGQGQGGSGAIAITADRLSIEGIGATFSTAIENHASADATGEAGPITVAANQLAIRNGGAILSRTQGASKAADITVTAGNLVLTGDAERGVRSGIVSQSLPGATGNTGAVNVAATGTLQLSNIGQIGSLIEGGGHAGPVAVRADTLTVSGTSTDTLTGIFSEAVRASTGNAGAVDVQAGHISLSGPSAQLGSITDAVGNAGSVSVQAGSLAITGTDGQSFTGIVSNAQGGSGAGGTVNVTTTGALAISSAGSITSDTYTQGKAGDVVVKAGSLTITGTGDQSFTGISSNAQPGSSGRAGTVNVTTTGPLAISQGGEIGSDTFSAGDAGAVTANAGSLTITGMGGQSFTGISSNARSGSSGRAGTVAAKVMDHLAISHGGEISSSTFSDGDGGTVSVRANSLSIDGASQEGPTGITSNARSGSSGPAGTVDVTVMDHLAISNAGMISSSTFSRGNGGTVFVRAGSLSIGGTRAQASGLLTGISTRAVPGSVGKAGSVFVAAGDLQVRGGGQIDSTTFGLGDGGRVAIVADRFLISGDGARFGSGIFSEPQPDTIGNTGIINIAARDLQVRNGGLISTSTFGEVSPGSINIRADKLLISRDGATSLTGIFSNTYGSAVAGVINIDAHDVQIRNGGLIGTDTFGAGKGGAVIAHVDRLLIPTA